MTHAAPHPIVVHADDLGLSEAVNHGILRAHREGVVTSTSLMVNMPAARQAATLARAATTLEVGLHLNFTEGRPLTEARSMLDGNGAFRPLPAQLVALASGRLVASEVLAEAAAQLARARELGLTVTHIDGHHHVHLFGIARSVVFVLARAEKLFVRRYCEALGDLLDGGIGAAAQRLLLQAAAGRGDWRGIPHADGSHDLTARRHPTAARLLARLRHGCRLLEVVCHPGDDDPSATHDPLRARRLEERTMLTRPGLRQAFVEAGFGLTTFRAVSLA